MKRLPAIVHHRVITFLLVLAAVVIGNLINQIFISNQPIEATKTEEQILAQLSKLEKDIRYQSTTIEQAQKERDRLQAALEYHHQLMDKTKTVTVQPTN